MADALHCGIRRRVRWTAWLLCAALNLAAVAHAGSVSVITHPDRKNIKVDQAMLRDFYTMRLRQWPDGRLATVFVLDDRSELHVHFCRQTLGTYPYVLRNRWDRLVFTGAGFAPVTVRDEKEMREKVARTPGAIGYVADRKRRRKSPARNRRADGAARRAR